ncbi:MAG: arginine repressor [Lachnospiraceae bacterium]|nr:arginine repressor [Lachnospiraceae bacterium]
MAGKKTKEDLNKATRREVILQLISEKNIATQKDLAAELLTAGFDVAQATLSRDIRELHLVKTALPDGSYAYQAPGKTENQQATAHFFQLFRNAVVHIDTALNQVVIHTYTGMAQAICAAFDGMKFDGVLGTIAGDDTILVIARDEEHARDIAMRLREV